MIRTITTVLLLALAVATSAQTTHQLTNVGNTFNPPLITMVAGDSIHLVLGAPHTCTQVDQATWNANQNTSNGGFNFAAGDHTFVIDVPGTYYYVCAVHASMGMKGQIIVDFNSGVADQANAAPLLLFPNPANKRVTLSGILPGSQVSVYDMNGRLVLRSSSSGTHVLDVSALEIGTYLVMVSDQQGKAVSQERLVITR